MSCRFPTSFMRWQGKSVQFEKLALVPVKITFIGGQCDTTRKRPRLAALSGPQF